MQQVDNGAIYLTMIKKYLIGSIYNYIDIY